MERAGIQPFKGRFLFAYFIMKEETKALDFPNRNPYFCSHNEESCNTRI